MTGSSRIPIAGSGYIRGSAGSGRIRSALLSVASVTAVSLAMLAAGPSPAFAEAPAWNIATESAPTNLQPGDEVKLIVVASDLGDGPVNGGNNPVSITDQLPAGLTAETITGSIKNGVEVKCPSGEHPSPPLTCTFTGAVHPYEQLTVTIKAAVEEPPGTNTTLANQVTIEGGGAPAVTSADPLSVTGAASPFGVHGLQVALLNEDGSAATQAGLPPFQLTTSLTINQSAIREPVALPKDLSFTLPPGLIGNPTAVAQCSEVDFAALVDETNLCPPSTVVGVATVTAFEPDYGVVITKTVPVFNLVPAQGEPARFGFNVAGKIPIVIDTSVRSGRDYAVVATVRNATQTAGLLSSQVSLWGDPGDSSHNNSRGWECVADGAFDNQIGKTCPASSQEPEASFLRTPTSCESSPASEPVVSSVEADSWAEPGEYVSDEYNWTSLNGEPLGFTGCQSLPFGPQLLVAPESEGKPPTQTASTPTALTVEVDVPQQGLAEPGKLAEADVEDSTVTLPEGVELSPSAANGLQACTEAQVGYEGPGQDGQLDFSKASPSCPAASQVGVVHIKTPLLSHELEGAVYLATPAPSAEAGQNPFNSLIALYLVAEDPVSGVMVKLAGEGHVAPGTLRVSTTFANTPQVPFEELRLELFGGPRASLSTPADCESFSTEAVFTPWSGTGPVPVDSPGEEFQTTSGPDGSGCPSGALPFGPGFLAQSTSAQAGGFTGFDLELSRPDGDQALGSVSMHLPEGVAALLSSVELCGEAQAAASACPAGSLVGEATAVAGLGPEPYVERGGKVYITGPYGGAPFGLEIVTPAVAGPFDLGTVTVRSKLYINPENASVTIVSDSLPTQLRGIPLQLKKVLVTVNRPDFEFNPTSCDPMRIEGTISGAEGASAGVSSPFQVSGCQGLPFAPSLTAATNGHASKANGADLVVKVGSGGMGPNGVAQAGIAKVDLQLPKTLPARLSTLQKACTEAAFDSNPASCPEGSDIGTATIHTPVLRSALSGPAYLVSHGNAAFPDVEFVLQGEGIMLVLDGKTQIKGGVTYSRFESTPDAPFTRFETVLPAGPHSALTADVAEKKKYDLCGESLSMPTTITGQNGAVIERDTKIAVQGCGAVKAAKTKKLTNAQKLAKALAACRKRDRHAKARRARCERQARRRYPPHKSARKAKHAH